MPLTEHLTKNAPELNATTVYRGKNTMGEKKEKKIRLLNCSEANHVKWGATIKLSAKCQIQSPCIFNKRYHTFTTRTNLIDFPESTEIKCSSVDLIG